ncbi:MAG: tRNA (guanosine(37)-N1)-methyltransferase TrmD [Myxococcales bacterium]|nr:tRNA (guanosine(37)-N1)-methyltransferase TrmD [Myxococcales bacterium]
MRFDVLTLFPEMFDGFLRVGVVGRSVAAGRHTVRFKSPREFGHGRHRSVDDGPYGGGAGMVMRVDCIVSGLEAFDAEAPLAEDGSAITARRILLTPQGKRVTQERAVLLAATPAIALVCGRYEGIDERVHGYVDEELSLGDFVMSGGEVAAMAVIDMIARLEPGVLGNAASLERESHSQGCGGLLEYPQYTRPPEFRGARVPDVLLGGNHAAILDWRTAEAEARTRERRPDLAERAERRS